jgi:hypothetical protein
MIKDVFITMDFLWLHYFSPSACRRPLHDAKMIGLNGSLQSSSRFTHGFLSRSGLGLPYGETDLDGDLPMFDPVLLDAPAGLDHLEPAQALNGLAGALERGVDGILDALGRGAGEFDERIDFVLHTFCSVLAAANGLRLGGPSRYSSPGIEPEKDEQQQKRQVKINVNTEQFSESK